MKKRTLALFAAIVLLTLAVIPVTSLALTWQKYVYTKNGKTLNMRSSMTTKTRDNIIAQIPYGAVVTMVGYENNTWSKIIYNHMTGYVVTRYLVDSKPGPKPKPQPTTTPAPSASLNFSGFKAVEYDAMVRPSAPGGFANMRWAPSKKMAIHERVYTGTILEVIAENNTWAQIRNTETGSVGFMMRSFLVMLAN